jgi:hypothetical protein
LAVIADNDLQILGAGQIERMINPTYQQQMEWFWAIQN